MEGGSTMTPFATLTLSSRVFKKAALLVVRVWYLTKSSRSCPS